MKSNFFFLLSTIISSQASFGAECAPPITRAWKNFSTLELEKKWEAKAKLPCESYAIAYAIFLKQAENETGVEWLVKTIGALKRAQDPQRIIQILVSSMANWPQLSSEVELRLALLEAVKDVTILQGRQSDSSWAEYFLGVQQSPIPEIGAAKFREDFPEEAQSLDKVKKVERQVKTFYLKKELGISQHYLGKEEFLAALFRLEFLLKQRFILEDRDLLVLLLNQIVHTEVMFAHYLKNPPGWGNKWPDSRVRAVPGIPLPYSREKAVNYFLDKAEKTKPENLLRNF